jgi:hypothetical protein
MGIVSVTTENIAEFVAKRPQTSELTTADAVNKANSDAPTLGKPVIKMGVETLGTPPEPQESSEKKSKPVQARIDELVREKHELDEAFQEEYDQRLRLEGELNALKSLNAPKAVEAKAQPVKAPDPAKYTDQALYDKDLETYQNAIIDARVERRVAEIDAARARSEADRKLAERIELAKKDLPDFVSVMAQAARDPHEAPAHIKAAIIEAERGPQIAYHLAKDAEERERLYALTPARALLELGRIELQYQPKAEPEAPPPPETTRAPLPMSKLKDSSTGIPVDLSQPQPFQQYRARRLEEIRQTRRRH